MKQEPLEQQKNNSMISLSKQSTTNESEVIEKIVPIKIEEPVVIKREASAMLKCQVCDKPLKSTKSLYAHIKNTHLSVKVMSTCPLCGLIINKQSISRHMKSIHDGQKQESKEKKMPLDQKEYRKRRRNERGLTDEQKQKIKQRKAGYEQLCTLCGKVLTSVFNLKTHVDTIHLNIKFQCAKCGNVMACIQSLRRHTRISHKDENTKLYPCNICQQECNEKSKLRWHISTIHLGSKTFKCGICGISFGLACNLKSHVKIVHEKIKPFECQICSFKFGVKSSLKQHMQTHKVKVN